jgi:hypothetical protein
VMQPYFQMIRNLPVSNNRVRDVPFLEESDDASGL